MGRYYRTIDLGTDHGIPHYLHLAADSERATEISTNKSRTIRIWLPKRARCSVRAIIAIIISC